MGEMLAKRLFRIDQVGKLIVTDLDAGRAALVATRLAANSSCEPHSVEFLAPIDRMELPEQ